MAAPALKVGTKIRILIDNAEGANVKKGDIGVISNIIGTPDFRHYQVQMVNGTDWWSLTQDSFEYWKDKEDQISSPPHYTKGTIQPIDYIESHNFPFHIANVIKYVTRAEHKGTELTDLRKAAWYLNRYIEIKEKGNK